MRSPGLLRSALPVNAHGRSRWSAVIDVSNQNDAQQILQVMDWGEMAGTAIHVSRFEGPPQESGLGPMGNEADETRRKIRNEIVRQPCTHQRTVDELRDDQGRSTGELRCIECRAVFPNSYNSRRPTTSGEELPARPLSH